MSCPDCGSVGRSGGGGGAWVARETLAGRISTLPGGRKAWLAAGVVVLAGSLVAAASLIASAGGETRTGAVGRADAGGGGASDRVGGGAGDRVGGAPTRISPSDTRPDTGPSTSSPATPPALPGQPAPRYTAWAGPGCSTGEYREYGRFETGDAGWYTVASGGFRGGVCDGLFSAVPMSGSPDEDRGSTATWSWHLGSGFRECALTVFVPRSDRDRDVAGNPTVYRVLSDPANADSAYTGFAVRQSVHRGSAVDVNSYPVKGDTFAVQLIDRGRDWGSTGLVGAHHAAAQLKVSCR